MQPQYAFYFADLLIIFLILAINVVMFILILQKLTCGRNKKLARASDRDKKQSITRAINAIAISAVLGLTWVFGFLTIVENRGSSLVFQVLFCLFNSLQGLFIFVLFCLRLEEVRNVWKEWLACGKSDNGGVHASTGGHSRGTDVGNTRSTGVSNEVASNPPERIELISKFQDKTSNGKNKTTNGQETSINGRNTTTSGQENIPKQPENELLSKSEEEAANGEKTLEPQQSEGVESPPVDGPPLE